MINYLDYPNTKMSGNNRLMLKEVRHSRFYGATDLSEHIDKLRKEAQGLQNPEVDIYSSSEYGDEYVSVDIYGWRYATTEDKQTIKKNLETRADMKRRQEEGQLALLKEARPDLFVNTDAPSDEHDR